MIIIIIIIITIDYAPRKGLLLLYNVFRILFYSMFILLFKINKIFIHVLNKLVLKSRPIWWLRQALIL